MTERERVVRAVRHLETDCVPFQLDLTQGVYERLKLHYGDGEFLYTAVGNHLIKEKNKNHRPLDPRRYQDIFGVIWSLEQEGGDIGIVRDFALTGPDIGLFNFPKPDEALISAKCERMIGERANLFKVFEIPFSLFERAWTLRGMESLLMDFLLEEAFAHELLDRILEYNLGVIDIAARYPIDCIMFGDDWGQQRGLIFGAKLWRQYIKPRLAKMYERVKQHGLFVCQHSCGDNRELFGELIDIGLDIYNTFQPEIYDAEAFKREYGRHLTIYGGVSTQDVLSRGAPDDVAKQTRRMMRTLGKGGGYIVAPTHQMPMDVPLENILAFVDTVKNQ